MVIPGADVSHPAPNANNRPSVTSLVWSYDQFATQYASYTRVQNPHEEIIDDLGEMMSVGFLFATGVF
jgi:eukaryotic translation initiation factor 2C